MMASTVLRMHGVVTGTGGVLSECSSADRQSDGLQITKNFNLFRINQSILKIPNTALINLF